MERRELYIFTWREYPTKQHYEDQDNARKQNYINSTSSFPFSIMGYFVQIYDMHYRAKGLWTPDHHNRTCFLSLHRM